MTLYVPLWVKLGVQSKVPLPLALSMKVAPPGKVEVESTGIVLSASLAVMLKLRLEPSVIPFEPMVARTGVWLPASVTVMATTSESTSKPSEATKVTLKIPAWVKPGVQLNEPLPSPLSVKLAPLGSVEVDRVGVLPSGSEAEMLKLRLLPSLTVLAPIALKRGVWLPASLTVIETISLSEATPSEAMKMTK